MKANTTKPFLTKADSPGAYASLMQNPPEHAARRHDGGEQQKQIKHGGACETSADTGPESKWS